MFFSIIVVYIYLDKYIIQSTTCYEIYIYSNKYKNWYKSLIITRYNSCISKWEKEKKKNETKEGENKESVVYYLSYFILLL